MWIENNNSLQADLKFKDFVTAFSFMTEVAFNVEKQNHHPTWENTYNRVKITLTTHDKGNTITEKDRKLAKTISEIYERVKS
jgi:4a-hydroxytetrahydrobiopterin dehydratase